MTIRGWIGPACAAALGLAAVSPVGATAVVRHTGVVQNAQVNDQIYCAMSNTDTAPLTISEVRIKNAAGTVVISNTNVVVGAMETRSLVHYGSSNQYRCEVDFASEADAEVVVVRIYTLVSLRSHDGDKALPLVGPQGPQGDPGPPGPPGNDATLPAVYTKRESNGSNTTNNKLQDAECDAGDQAIAGGVQLGSNLDTANNQDLADKVTILENRPLGGVSKWRGRAHETPVNGLGPLTWTLTTWVVCLDTTP